MPKQVEITADVRAVLERGDWPAPDIYALPPGKLDRPIYQAVDKVLTGLGGRWDRKAQGHRFARDARDAFEAALADGVAVDQKRTLEQFFTPRHIAARIALALDIAPGMTVLEPSAGAGDLIEQLLEIGVREAQITAVEIDPGLISDLHCRFPGATIIAADFLALPEDREVFDRVAMNPPFGRGADMAHVARAVRLLRPGGILAAIMSPHWTFAEDAQSLSFRAMLSTLSHEWTPLPEGSFRVSGTGVNTGVLIIRKGAN